MIYLLIGIPGSGKGWVASELKDKFMVLRPDNFKHIDSYLYALATIPSTPKPTLALTSFGVSEIMHAVRCIPIFIIEPGEIPKEHLVRQQAYIRRANYLNAFTGTAKEVLEYLKTV